jgi:hypothetical protein
MHIATKTGLFYAGYWALAAFGNLPIDHITLAVFAAFSAGVTEDFKVMKSAYHAAKVRKSLLWGAEEEERTARLQKEYDEDRARRLAAAADKARRLRP